MTPGQQYVAKIGFETLKAKTTYHLIAVDKGNSRVILADFGPKLNQYGLNFLSLKRFTSALENRLISICTQSECNRLPPWLSNREKECLNFSESLFDSDDSSESEYSRVESRLNDVLTAVDDADHIFSSLNFEWRLNQIARACKRNEPRYRAWVITYLAFGRNRWALLPPTKGRGKYDRTKPGPAGVRRGRPSRNGSAHGYDVTEDMKSKIIAGFLKYATEEKHLKDVCADTQTYTFGCQYKTNDKSETSIYHPLGEPFPTRGQIRYWVIKILGHETVYKTLLGDQLYRTKYPKPIGKYSEGMTDLMEMVYADASTSGEHPRSPLDNAPLDKLKVVKCHCGTSALGVGIAFGIGSERGSLYNQANASMALPKSLYCLLFGIVIDDEEWPVAHIPRALTTDQGPGSTKLVRNSSEGDGYKTSPNMTPAYTPQSNSPAEGNNKCEPETSGAPTFAVSRKTPTEMAADMVREMMASNRSKGVKRRLTPEQTEAGIASPIQLWNDYASKGRQAGITKHITDVITQYVPKVTFKITEGFLTRCGIIYRSDELSETDLFREIYNHEGAILEGWAFDISNRIEWVRVGKEIIMVSPISNVRTRENERILSAPDLLRHDDAIKAGATKAANMREAEEVRLRIESLEESGKKYKSPTRLKGRAKVRTPYKKKQASALNNS
jgi:hypothetical protein